MGHRHAAAGLELGAKNGANRRAKLSLPSIGPQGVATVCGWRRNTCREASQLRTPSVVVSVNKTSSIAAASPGRQRTVSTTAGRFFFIWIGVVYTSNAPASHRREMQ